MTRYLNDLVAGLAPRLASPMDRIELDRPDALYVFFPPGDWNGGASVTPWPTDKFPGLDRVYIPRLVS